MALPQHKLDQKSECLDEEQLTTVRTMCELVISNNLEGFKILFDSINDQDLAQIIPTLLLKVEEVAPALIRDNPRFRMENHDINFVLNALLERYPKLKSSFKFLSDDKNRFLFLPDGIRVIVDYLQNKAALTLKCQVFRNYEEMGAFLETLDVEPGHLKCTILLRNAHNEERKNHITPIYVEKVGDRWDILITDSIAGTEMAKDCLREIRKVFKTQTSSTSTRRFYVFKTRRQFDGVSCAIFSSRDLVQISKHPQIMHYVKRVSGDAPPSKRGVVYFDMLPPAFMKVMQDLNEIDAYVRDNNHEERVIHYNKKTSKDETLLENVERNRKAVAVENSDMREINNYIPRKAIKYLGVIIANVIGQNAL